MATRERPVATFLASAAFRNPLTPWLVLPYCFVRSLEYPVPVGTRSSQERTDAELLDRIHRHFLSRYDCGSHRTRRNPPCSLSHWVSAHGHGLYGGPCLGWALQSGGLSGRPASG